ncbi:MAG: TauD/TfdA family dioxygenase, partial [Blastocatellia bacterium]
MDNPKPRKITAERLAEAAKKSVTISTSASLVRAGYLDSRSCLPLVIEPALKNIDLISWAGSNRDRVESDLSRHGAILFRGFRVSGACEFEALIRTLYGEPLQYQERSSPRSQVSGRIYTSTDYPSDQSIFLHNENSYQKTWPMRILFFCETPPDEGGETPIADCRRIFDRLDPMVRNDFIARRWMYVRNFNDGFGLPWQTVFQTEDRGVAEEHCRRNQITCEWKENGRLRTRAIRRAAQDHPLTGEPVWFNHAAFFHVSTLETGIRDSLLALFNEEDLPSNTYYGDGVPIEGSTAELLRNAYRRESVYFSWKRSDILLLDNMLVAHGRAPYKGSRAVLVGMARPFEP